MELGETGEEAGSQGRAGEVWAERGHVPSHGWAHGEADLWRSEMCAGAATNMEGAWMEVKAELFLLTLLRVPKCCTTQDLPIHPHLSSSPAKEGLQAAVSREMAAFHGEKNLCFQRSYPTTSHLP